MSATEGAVARGPRRTWDSNLLKLIAIAAMTVDHLAWMLFPGYDRSALALVMHVIGRLTCPIMCFFIAEGYHYTRSKAKYAARLLLLAVVSHFAYVFASHDFTGWRSFIPFASGSVLNQTSVVWSLLGGLLMLWVCDSERLKTPVKVVCVLLLCAVTFPADWSCIAALCILSIGSNRNAPKKQILWCLFYVSLYAVVYCLALDRVYGLLQLCVVLSIPLLARYNGRRGASPAINRVMKWLFYLYYPLHLFIIGLLQWLPQG